MSDKLSHQSQESIQTALACAAVEVLREATQVTHCSMLTSDKKRNVNTYRISKGILAAVLFQVAVWLVPQIVHSELDSEEGGVRRHIVQSPGGERQVKAVDNADNEN